jgi:hypothetical protein
MTNATKTLSIVFVGTLALSLAASWRWEPASAAFEEELLAVDTSAVQAVRIASPERPTVRLERADAGWTVAPADTTAAYPASTRAVNRLLSTLPSLQVGAVATRQPRKHPRYGVDSTGTTVTMLGTEDAPLGRLIVGRTQFRTSQAGRQRRSPLQRRRRGGTPITYVRPPEQPDVYSVEHSLRTVSGRSVDDWRDKSIWAVSRADVQRIDFRYPADSAFTVRRVAPADSAAAQRAWVSAGDTLSQSEVSPALRMLTAPRASAFANSLSPNDLGAPLYTLRLHLSSGARRTLRLFRAPGSFYRATADGYPYVAEVRRGRWDRSVLRGRSAFLQGE